MRGREISALGMVSIQGQRGRGVGVDEPATKCAPLDRDCQQGEEGGGGDRRGAVGSGGERQGEAGNGRERRGTAGIGGGACREGGEGRG